VAGLLNFWIERLFTKEAVLQQLRTDGTISDLVRRKALELGEVYEAPSTLELNNASWTVVRSTDGMAEGYRQALGWAERACELKPGVGFTLNTLRVAQYRTGQYEQALKTLTRSEQLNAKDKRFGGPVPSNIAFQAMTHHQLGQEERAVELLARLREIMKQNRWARDAESLAFLREAEVLIEGKHTPLSSSKKKPD
jgi:tetratricopeptide (TPR) repeat protein